MKKTSLKVMVALLSAALLAAPAMASSIKVSWDPDRVRPGGVLMMQVTSPVPLMAAEAAMGDERFPLVRGAEDTYLALIGVDVKVSEPVVTVDFALFPARGGPPYRIRADLKVRQFIPPAEKVQELSLPTGMVDLTQKRISQVARDNDNLGEALAARSLKRYWAEGFVLPVNGRITTEFGTGRVLNGKTRSPHSGTDIAGKKGTPIKAANSGLVVLADQFYLSGNTVVVDHGWGVSTLYAHLNKIHVQEGQEVQRGQVLGTVGATGRATGPHLHFGAFIRGAKIDPLQLIEVTRDLSAGMAPGGKTAHD